MTPEMRIFRSPPVPPRFCLQLDDASLAQMPALRRIPASTGGRPAFAILAFNFGQPQHDRLLDSPNPWYCLSHGGGAVNSARNTTDRGFVPRLESARGVAALLVAAAHTAQARWDTDLPLIPAAPDWNEPGWGTALRIFGALANGGAAVYFFFVLSGFVLALSLDRDTSRIGNLAGRFLIRRIARLYPAVGATIILFLGVYWLTGAALSSPVYYTPISLLRNALLVNVEIDGVMWSLQAEVIAIPAIFALVLIERRWGIGPLVVVAALLVALSFKPSWNRFIGPPIVPFYCFVFGILVRSVGRRGVSRLSGKGASLAFVVSVVGLFAARPLLGSTSNFSLVTEGLASAAIVAVVAYGRDVRTARPLDLSFMRFYGRISYSFYLLHPLTMIVTWNISDELKPLLEAGVPGVVVAFGLFALSTAAITPLAWLSWRFVEQPGIALGRRIMREAPALTIRLRPAIAAPAPAS
jgi:peptidoglycan/LPS O-acetylase OafA/YrhL